MLSNVLTSSNTTSLVVGAYECKVLIQILVIQCTVKCEDLNALFVSCLDSRHGSCGVVCGKCNCIIACAYVVVDQVGALVSVKLLVAKCRSRDTKLLTLRLDTFLNTLIESVVLCTNDECQLQVCQILCLACCVSVSISCRSLCGLLCLCVCCCVCALSRLGAACCQRCNHHCCHQSC